VTMIVVKGRDEQGRRINSMDFEKMVRKAAAESTHLILESYGQHNIGLRLQRQDGLQIEVKGPSGQRLGCMGMPGTSIVCHGATSDDVGYLNIGAEITVLGDATNGACNAMAMGKVYIKGSIGARGLTMTKWNPDYDKPQLWVLGSTGDSFANSTAAVLLWSAASIRRIRRMSPAIGPCVGMVGGLIYFRGKTDGSYAKNNARLDKPNDEQWQWLMDRMGPFLAKIGSPDTLAALSVREEWQVLVSITPQERALMFAGPLPMAEFREKFWKNAFGGGDPLRDIAPGLDRSPIDAIVSGDLRRNKPYWANCEWQPPVPTTVRSIFRPWTDCVLSGRGGSTRRMRCCLDIPRCPPWSAEPYVPISVWKTVPGKVWTARSTFRFLGVPSAILRPRLQPNPSARRLQ